MVRAILPLLAAVFLLGCSKPAMTNTEYATAFKNATEKYFSVSEEIAESELPDKTGLSREERTKILAEHVRTQNSKIRALIPEFKLLNPPTSYEPLHAAYLTLLEGQVKRDEEYAASIAADDREASKRLSDEYYTFLKDQMGKVLNEIEKAGGDVSKLREDFNRSMQGLGS